MATLKQVAEMAGCSTAVASAVLNSVKTTTAVGAATRERVEAAARELDYRPHLGARGMKQQKSRIVGTLLRNNARLQSHEQFSHPLAWEFVLGINKALEEAGYVMALLHSSDIAEAKYFGARALQGRLLDGVIVVSDVPSVSPPEMESLVPACVWLDSSEWHEEGCVRRDEYHAGELCAREVAALGYRRWIVLTPHNLSDPGMHYSAPERLAGIYAAAQEVGANVELFPTINSGPPDFTKLWPQLIPEVAVISLGFYTAQALQYASSASNLRIGRDFALACCDDGQHGNSSQWVQLSRVSFDRYDAGFRAASMLVEMLNNSTAKPASLRLKGEWLPGTTAQPCRKR